MDKQKLEEIAAQFSPEMDVATGKWFGKPCVKAGKKTFVVLWRGDLAFKLTGAAHSEALQIEGAHLFDPRGKGHPMKEWVQVPVAQSSTWNRFAQLAYEYVAGFAETRKNRLIADHIDVRRDILDTASSVSPAGRDEVFLGIWSVKDLLAHLVGWDFANKEAIQAILAGKLPEFYSHFDRDWKTYNTRLVAEYKKDDFAELVLSMENSHRQLIDLLRAVPAEALNKDHGVRFRGYKVTIARTLQAEIDDEKTHLTQIKEFGDRVVNPAGERSR